MELSFFFWLIINNQIYRRSRPIILVTDSSLRTMRRRHTHIHELSSCAVLPLLWICPYKVINIKGLHMRLRGKYSNKEGK